MKVITKIFIPLILLLAIIGGCEDADSIIGESAYDGQPFLRFYLITNSNGEPIGDEEIQVGKIPTEEYTHTSIKPVAIPVSLTYPGLENEITAAYSMDLSEDYGGYRIYPETLSFGTDKLMDTIFISFDSRWNAADSVKFDFELVGCSDNNVSLGHLNDFDSNKKLGVKLGDLITTYSFPENSINIEGVQGEEVFFDIGFPQEYFLEEISSLQLFSETKEFDYELERITYDDDLSRITYKMTLLENIDIDERRFSTSFTLLDGLEYVIGGNKFLDIVKPRKVDRDVSVNTAAHFYDLNNPYYRTYGENWLFHEGDGVCNWRSYTQFTYPVVVDKDDENAVLYSDGGTVDESDDVYHHAFKISFLSPNAGRTTNPFGMKYWFDNEYTDDDKSPGFNIAEAVEFFPKDGTSTTEGYVEVREQILTISSRSGATYYIEFGGEGTYKEISLGLYEVDLQLRATNEELFGGTRVVYNKFYNSNSYGGDPDPLTVDCFDIVDL